MNPTKSVASEILAIINKHKQITAKQIVLELGVSQVTVFKHLKALITQGKINKIGAVPKVVYLAIENQSNSLQTKPQTETLNELNFSEQDIKLINSKFIFISPVGQIKYGADGLKAWCDKQKLDFTKTTHEYIQTWSKYSKFYTSKKCSVYIDASFKIQETFGQNSSLEKLFYLDFYALERFGKTKLAWLTFQAKQSQDSKLIEQIIDDVKENISNLIKLFGFDAVAFVPPTVTRKVQFMSILEQKLAIELPKIKIQKLIFDTPIQQKSLKDKADRLENATKTFYVSLQTKYKKVLLIDDFVGSGATLNQIALKIKENKVAKSVYGLALTGSFKGFEVVNQV